eukprot:TRINITY_DN10359_c0_g1_i1.p1 TRINITY_DN10359_c0_g1~~TRINITY_DN10359_c0_g1_i1.p1  ORF type:complete len:210 (-),score=33.02 TRINITY_DN10359_c0_g1_i1:123-752(-)
MGNLTRELILDSQDYLVLQDQSQTPGGGIDADAGLPAGVARALSLSALTSWYRPLLTETNTTVVLYSTWGRKTGDPPNAKCCGYETFVSMNERTTEGYNMYAQSLQGVQVRTAACGRAWELAYNQSRHSQGVFPCLYSHSRNGTDECVLDQLGTGGHPSVLGQYLNTLVFMHTVFGVDPATVSWAPILVSRADASTLRALAHESVVSVS